MNQSRLILEPTNRGRPTNPEIKINPEIASETIPQAWEHLGNWYYNFPGSVAECGRLLLRVEQWNRYIEENPDFGDKLPKNGCRNWSNGAYIHQGTNRYYWAGYPCGTLSFNYDRDSANFWSTFDSYRAYGFSLRCIKE